MTDHTNLVFQHMPLPPPYRWVNLLERGAGFYLAPHEHSFTHLIYMLSGELTVITDEREFVLHAGGAMIIPAHFDHELISDGYTQVSIDIHDSDDPRYTDFFAVFTRPTMYKLPEMMPNIREITTLDIDSPLSRSLLCCWCDLILFTSAQTVLNADENPLKKRILSYIDAHLSGSFTLGGAAAELFISPSHLERSCKAIFGMGLIALRNRRRYEKACSMLLIDRTPIRSIGESLGFAEASNFSGFFKRYAGCSPAEYRKNFMG